MPTYLYGTIINKASDDVKSSFIYLLVDNAIVNVVISKQNFRLYELFVLYRQR